MSLDGTAIQKVYDLGQKPFIIERPGFAPEFALPRGDGAWETRGASRYTPAPVALATLTGVSRYLDENVDELDKSKVMLVATHGSVSLVAKLGTQEEQFHRACYLQSTAEVGRQAFGAFAEVEDFLLNLRTQFERTESRDNLCAVLSSVSENDIRSADDDGMSQQVTTGKAIKARSVLPGTVKLAPFRSFREVEQVESEFVLRLRPGPRGLPQVALFEADTNLWRITATDRVVEWLEQNCEGVSVVG